MTAVVEGSVAVSRTVADAVASGVGAGSVILADCANGPVVGWLVLESLRTTGRQERRCALVSPQDCAVISAGPISQVRVTGAPIPTEQEMPVWSTSVAESYWAAEQSRAERDRAVAQLAEHEQRLESIVDAAHQYADENSLCGVFDEFMQSQGLRARERDWVCEVDVSVRVRIPVRSHSADAAALVVDDDMVNDAVAQLRGSDLSEAIQQHDVVDTEEG